MLEDQCKSGAELPKMKLNFPVFPVEKSSRDVCFILYLLAFSFPGVHCNTTAASGLHCELYCMCCGRSNSLVHTIALQLCVCV